MFGAHDRMNEEPLAVVLQSDHQLCTKPLWLVLFKDGGMPCIALFEISLKQRSAFTSIAFFHCFDL